MPELRLLGKLHCFSGKDIEAHRTEVSPCQQIDHTLMLIYLSD